MDFWLYYLVAILGGATIYLGYRLSVRPPRSIFREPTNHIEIRSWKLKK